MKDYSGNVYCTTLYYFLNSQGNLIKHLVFLLWLYIRSPLPAPIGTVSTVDLTETFCMQNVCLYKCYDQMERLHALDIAWHLQLSLWSVRTLPWKASLESCRDMNKAGWHQWHSANARVQCTGTTSFMSAISYWTVEDCCGYHVRLLLVHSLPYYWKYRRKVTSVTYFLYFDEFLHKINLFNDI